MSQNKVVDINTTLAQRGARYGEFKNHANVTQELKDVVRNHLAIADKELPAYQQEAIDMVMHKIGRIINGDHNYIDSWRDGVGYLQLVVNDLEKQEGATDCRVVRQQVINGVKVDV